MEGCLGDLCWGGGIAKKKIKCLFLLVNDITVIQSF